MGAARTEHLFNVGGPPHARGRFRNEILVEVRKKFGGTLLPPPWPTLLKGGPIGGLPRRAAPRRRADQKPVTRRYWFSFHHLPTGTATLPAPTEGPARRPKIGDAASLISRPPTLADKVGDRRMVGNFAGRDASGGFIASPPAPSAYHPRPRDAGVRMDGRDIGGVPRMQPKNDAPSSWLPVSPRNE